MGRPEGRESSRESAQDTQGGRGQHGCAGETGTQAGTRMCRLLHSSAGNRPWRWATQTHRPRGPRCTASSPSAHQPFSRNAHLPFLDCDQICHSAQLPSSRSQTPQRAPENERERSMPIHQCCKHCSFPHRHTRPEPMLFQPPQTIWKKCQWQRGAQPIRKISGSCHKWQNQAGLCIHVLQEAHLQPVKWIQGMLTCFFSQGNWGFLLKMSQSGNY